MAQPLPNSATSYNFAFPLTDNGIADGCKIIKETLDQTQVCDKIKICVSFNVEDHSGATSIKFKKKSLNKIVLSGFNVSQIDIIKSLLKQHNIAINEFKMKGNYAVITNEEENAFLAEKFISFIAVKGLDEASRKLLGL